MSAPAERRPAPRSRRQFRPDIEGLRAVAVLGVVLFHTHVTALSGGYVGVDVFFVISGYLITGLLWGEVERRRTINLAAFYGRRARRLLPAAILVIIVTAIASRHWLPPLEVPSVAKDGVASALYVANYRFALPQTNYLNPVAATLSPFQQYWSLGVEEQFYLLWPLVLLGASLAWRRYRHRYQRHRWGPTDGPSRVTAIVGLSTVTVASFILSLWLTHVDQPWAFFSLPARAWELGAGGVLALIAPTWRQLPRAAAELVGWIGLAVIVGAYFLINAHTPFPGTAALAPVAGTLAVLAVGTRAGRAGPVFVLGRPPMRMTGRISYSWYLWHWPFLILAPYALGHALALWQNLAVAALSGLVAMACFLLVENPVRLSRWLASVPKRSLVTGGALSACGAASCVLVAASLPSLTGHGVAPVAKLSTSPAARQAAAHLPAAHLPAAQPPTPDAEPTTTLDPLAIAANSLTAQVNAAVAASLNTPDVPANLTPSLADAGESNSPTYYDGCMDSYLDDTVENCAFGDVGSATSVVLFGDSHASMWFPAVDAAADQHGWQLFNFAKATCPPLYNTPIFSPELGRNFSECDTWRQNALARIQAIHPALVVLAMTRDYAPIYGFSSYDQQWLTGLSQMVSVLHQMGSKVLVLGPVPIPPGIVYDCLSEHLTDAPACTWPVPEVVDAAGVASEKSGVTAAGGLYFDVEPWFCTAQQCGVIVDNILMWRDASHITEPYSAYLAPAMSAELAAVLSSG